MKRLLLIILIISALAMLMACGAPSEVSAPPPAKETTPTPSAISISAIELYTAYEDNEVAADMKFEGKILDVTGVISDISKDIAGTPYVVLTGGGWWAALGVQCLFSSKDETQLAQLSKGEEVTIRGKCKGCMINVLMGDCKLID